MRISNITQPFMIHEYRKTVKKPDLPKADPKDSADFTNKADSTGDSTVIAAIKSLVDVRIEKIDEVRQKIAAGYYDSEEFIDKLAERLIKDLL